MFQPVGGMDMIEKALENAIRKMLDKGKKLREIKAKYGKKGQGHISISGKKGVVLIKEI